MTERDAYAVVAGQILRAYRGEIRQDAFARSIQLSQSTLSRIENGQSLPDLFQLTAIGNVLDEPTGKIIEEINAAFVATTRIAHKLSGKKAWTTITTKAATGYAMIGITEMSAKRKLK